MIFPQYFVYKEIKSLHNWSTKAAPFRRNKVVLVGHTIHKFGYEKDSLD